jgi:hypothetical protein
LHHEELLSLYEYLFTCTTIITYCVNVKISAFTSEIGKSKA